MIKGVKIRSIIFHLPACVAVLSLQFVASTTSGNRTLFLGRTSQSILKNLESFERLYITFHNCAWSPIEKDDDNNNCGSENNNEEYWYLGLTECFRANVAYSLYGIVKGNDIDEGCTKHTYINSFFTSTGVESFIDSITSSDNTVLTTITKNDGTEINSECISDGYNENNYEDGSYSHNQQFNMNAKSFGLGCSSLVSEIKSDTEFIYNTYQGSYCDGRHVLETTDTLTSFNEEIKQVKCMLLYDISSSNDQSENENENNNNSADINLLESSQICDVREFSNQCPDPFGYLSKNIRKEAVQAEKSKYKRREAIKSFVSYLLLVAGFILILVSVDRMLSNIRERKKAIELERKLENDLLKPNSRSRPSSGEKKSVDRGWWLRWERRYDPKQRDNKKSKPMDVIEVPKVVNKTVNGDAEDQYDQLHSGLTSDYSTYSVVGISRMINKKSLREGDDDISPSKRKRLNFLLKVFQRKQQIALQKQLEQYKQQPHDQK